MNRDTCFGRAAAVWEATESARHVTIRVFDLRWQNADTRLRRVIESLSSGTSSQELPSVLRRLRFSLNCLPLPLHDPAMWSPGTQEGALERIRLHAEIAESTPLLDLYALLSELIQARVTNPLWDAVSESWSSLRKPIVIVAHRSSHVKAIETLVSSVERGSDAVVVVKQNELPELWGTRTTLVFGPPSLGAEWLRAQPRGDVVWVHHTWNRSLTSPDSLLPFTSAPARTPTIEDLTSLDTLDRAREGSADNPPEDSWTPYDWTRVRSGLGLNSETQPAIDDEGPALVLAKIVALADDQYVLIPAEEGTTVSVFNPAVAKVERRGARDIRAGMFVLVRTESGRDLIRDLVESRFLKDPQRCFSRLEEWKRPLRRRLRELGPHEVRRALRAYGLDAEEVTIRSWTTDLVYGPGNEPWLRSLLTFLGVDGADEHWAVLEALRRAGRKAGHYVRLQLLDQARQVDPVRARRESVLTFALKGVYGGTVKAFKVEAVSADPVEAPSNALGRIY